MLFRSGTAIGMGVIGSATAKNIGTISTLATQLGMYGLNGAYLENDGSITTDGGVGMFIEGSGSSAVNTGSIITVTNQGIGMYVNGGATAENESTISITNGSTGMYINEGGTIANNGSINLEAGTFGNTGMYGEGYKIESIDNTDNQVINNGVISINSRGSSGIFIEKSGVSATNNSKIEVNAEGSFAISSTGSNIITNSKEAYISIANDINADVFNIDGGIVTNSGRIYLGNTGNLYTGSGTIYNYGNVTGANSNLQSLTADTNFIMEKGGTVTKDDNTNYRLNTATVGLSYMPELFAVNDTQSNTLDLSFEADNLMSYSYMYEIFSDDFSASARRKDFSLISDTAIGKFLEYIYGDADDSTTKSKIYHALRSSRGEKEFDKYLDKFFGRDLYPMVIFQTRDAINFTTNNILDNLETRYNTAKKNSYIVGYSFENFRKRGYDRVTGYNEYLNGFYLGKQYTFNNSSDYGFVFSYTRLDSEYKDDAGKRDDNFFQGSAFMNYAKDDVKGIGMFYLGYAKGDIKRHLDLEFKKFEGETVSFENINEHYKADTKNFYVGTSGKISKQYNFNSFFIEPEAKAYLMGVFQRGMNETGGEFAIHLDEMNKVFSNIKIGANIGKTFTPRDEYLVTVKLKGALAQDINSSNDNLKIKLESLSDETTSLNIDRRNQFTQELGTRVDFQKQAVDDLTLYVDYKYIFEDKNSWKVSSGFVYSF